MNNNVHKSIKWGPYFKNYSVSLARYNLFNNFYHNQLSGYKKYGYLFYFLNKHNINLKVYKNIWKNFDNYRVLTFHYKNKKLKITLFNLKRLLVNLSPGMVTKKLGIEEKKEKKSIKIFNIMVKSVFKAIKPSNQLFRYFFQFKGTTVFINKYIDYINKLNVKFKEVYFIYTPQIPNKFVFKKVRSLKKNFRKNYLIVK